MFIYVTNELNLSLKGIYLQELMVSLESILKFIFIFQSRYTILVEIRQIMRKIPQANTN